MSNESFPTVGREVHLIARPTGVAEDSDFELVEAAVAEPGPKEVVVRNNWISVDPYMRGRMNDVPSYVPPFRLGEPLEGGAVGTVVASRAEGVPEGTTVLHHLGWREYATVPACHVQPLEVEDSPEEAYLGALGMTGLTAYVGLKKIAPVRSGDVAFISGAAGAVGIVAARAAKALGASRVIGSAGGPEKVALLVDELGYDAAVDYRKGSLSRQLGVAAPDGLDIYFDNVGGDHLRAALANMNDYGRIALCGAISEYNEERLPPGPNLITAIGKRLTLRGYIVTDYDDLREEYLQLARGWLRDGSLPLRETVVTGIENAVGAFLGLLNGANTGKMLVRLEGVEG